MFSSEAWLANPSSDFYNGEATQSARFDRGSSAYLSETLGTPTTRRRWTLSMWIKRSKISYNFSPLFSTGNLICRFNSSDTLQLYDYDGNFDINLTTTQVFRDTSAWYNLVFVMDIDGESGNDRLKLYSNGVRVSWSGTDPASYDPRWNYASIHYIGRENTTSNYFDGYMAEFNFVDGSALDPTSFGQFKNGSVWIAKRYTGSYGTNGFRLQFNQTGVGTGSSSTIGADTSGNANHFSSSGIVASDCNMPDSPENNFCTMNSLINGYGTNITMSEGNLAGTGTSSQYNNTLGTILMTSGKWYWEISSANFNNYDMLGIAIETALQTGDSTPYSQNGVIAYATQGAVYNESGSGTGSYTSFQASEIIGIAVDLDASPRTFKFYNNNTLQGTINLSSNFDNVGILPFFCIGNTDTIKVNFGQDSSFAGLKTAQGNTDENDIGDFYYTPQGLALCTSNLPETTISPNADTQADDYFNTKTYTGDGSTDRAITGIGFQPDWVWIKERNTATSHMIYNVISGANKRLSSNNNNLEATDTDGLKSFDADGWTMDAKGSINGNGDTYVAWNWKAGGTASSYTPTGATASVSMTRNSTAGFSIVTYTGTGTANDVGDQALGHGLQVNDVDTKPDMMIIKSRSSDYAGNWKVWHKDMGGNLTTDFLTLNTTSGTASTSDKVWDGAEPTSTLFSVGYDWDVNKNSATYVGYFFASVEGYSRFGSFSGNGSADGTMIFTSFRPSFIMTKETSATSSWNIYDNVRSNDNPATELLIANSSNSEGTGTDIDIVSNGFKIRSTSGNINTSGNNYIYMAFAQQPFRYANAR